MLHGRYFPELVEVMSLPALLLGLGAVLALLLLGRLAAPRLVPAWGVRAAALGSALALAWEGASRLGLVSAVLLPPPTVILSNLGLMWSVGFLQPHILASVSRLLLALALATATAIPLGVLVGQLRTLGDYVEPFLDMLRMVPAPAWLPLAILWFGLGNASTIFIIWLGAFFPIFLNTLTAARRADRAQVETVLTFGGDVFDIAWEVIIPASLPFILTGVRIGMGLGWIVLLTAELASTSVAGGLGYMMEDARSLLDAATVLSGMVVVGTLGTLLDLALRELERRWTRRLLPA
jgi:NitT/TauT family transport system permease protein/sulfonate transport system permease protein